MRQWIKKAIDKILDSSIQIVSDNNRYAQWKDNQRNILNEKYLSLVDFHIELLEDISPNLSMQQSKM